MKFTTLSHRLIKRLITVYISIIGISQKNKKQKAVEEIFETIVTENFS